MDIPPDRKGKTTLCQHPSRLLLAILFILSIVLVYILVIVIVRILQGAGCKNGLLTLIKSNSSKLFPVGDERIFSHDFVKSEFTLMDISLAKTQREGKRGRNVHLSIPPWAPGSTQPSPCYL
jgi:hypothetical protein